jgi:hypothetical protein
MVPVPEGHTQTVLLILRGIQRFTRLGIALIGEFAVTVNDVIAAPLQFSGDRGLACSRTPSTK